jgi:hypothetical protein
MVIGLLDFVWPALLLSARMRGIWPVLIGLILELIVLRYLFPMSWKRAAAVDLTMNAISGIVGAFAIPLAGMAWEYFPGLLLYKWLNWGTFNPVTWTATCVMAVFISTGIETLVVWKLFSYQVTSRRFWSIATANLLSTALAWGSLVIRPPQF